MRREQGDAGPSLVWAVLLAVVVIGLVIYGLGRLTRAESRSRAVRLVRDSLRRRFGKVRRERGELVVHHGGVEVRLSVPPTERGSGSFGEVPLIVRCAVLDTSLAPFVLRHDFRSELEHRGVFGQDVQTGAHLFAGVVRCDGTSVVVESDTTRTGQSVLLASAIARAPRVALERIARELGLSPQTQMTLGTERDAVDVRVDGGIRVSSHAPPDPSLVNALVQKLPLALEQAAAWDPAIHEVVVEIGHDIRVPLTVAQVALANHPRGRVIRELGDGLGGTLELGRNVALTIPLVSNSEHVRRAVGLVRELIARSHDGAFR